MVRKYLDYLLNWEADKSRKPLIIYGARQVGKTYLVLELFAKKYYKDRYLRIDCSNDYDFVNYISNHDSLESLLEYLEIRYKFKPSDNNLLIFDEVQECLAIIKMLKHFCENRRDIKVIATGSLVRIKLSRNSNKNFLYPVGKVNTLTMFPLDFEEFLLNYDNDIYNYVKNKYKNKEIIAKEIHEEILKLLDIYLFLGGMPEVVDTYLENKGDKLKAFNKSIKVIHEIYDNYLADMELYQVSKESIIKSRLLFDNIFCQLNKENKNFKVSQVINNAKNRDVINPISWLLTSMVIYKANSLKEIVRPPLITNEEGMYRLYLADMGIFTYQSKLSVRSFLLDNNTLSGVYYENFVACELKNRGIDLFYWKGKNDYELEFILNINNRIIPIDVKKGRGKLNSVLNFRLHNNNDVVIKVSKNNYGYDKINKILTIPFYYLPFLLDDIVNGDFTY